MLNVIAIEAENYISIGDRQRLDVHEPGMYLLKGFNLDGGDQVGSVGSGKSTLMSIVEFVNWGDVRDRFKTKDAVIHKQVKRNCMAAYEAIDPSTGTKWRAERYRKHSTHKDALRLGWWEESKNEWNFDATMTTSAATQTKLLEMFAMPRELYRRSARLDRDNLGQFLMLNEKERANMFEALVHADDMTRLAKKAKTRYDAANTLVKNLTAEVMALDSTITSLAQGIVDARKQRADDLLAAQNALTAAEAALVKSNESQLSASKICETINQRKTAIEECNTFGAEMAKNKIDYSVDTNRSAQAKANSEEKQKQASFKVTQIQTKKDDIARKQASAESKRSEAESKKILATQKRTSEYNNRITGAGYDRIQAQGVIDRADTMMREAELIEGVKCKTCGGDVDPDATESLREAKRKMARELHATHRRHLENAEIMDREAAELLVVADALDKEAEALIAEGARYDDEAIAMQGEISAMEGELSKLKEETAALYQEHLDYEQRIKDAIAKNQASDAVVASRYAEAMKIGSDIPAKYLTMTPEDIDAELGGFERAVNEARANVELLSQPADESVVMNTIKQNKTLVGEKRKELANAQTDAEEYMFWRRALDLGEENSVRQYFMETVIPAFNVFVQDNLDRLWEGDLRVVFDTSLNETIFRNGEEYDAGEFSTGERTRVDLAICLALFEMVRMNVGEIGVVFMDEIFTNVDEPTTSAFLELIREKYEKDSAVYVASHQTYVADNIRAKNVLSVVKEDGFSRIHYGDFADELDD